MNSTSSHNWPSPREPKHICDSSTFKNFVFLYVEMKFVFPFPESFTLLLCHMYLIQICTIMKNCEKINEQVKWSWLNHHLNQSLIFTKDKTWPTFYSYQRTNKGYANFSLTTISCDHVVTRVCNPPPDIMIPLP